MDNARALTTCPQADQISSRHNPWRLDKGQSADGWPSNLTAPKNGPATRGHFSPPRTHATLCRPRRGGFALKRVKRRLKRVGIDVVEERGELSLLPLPCGLPYAVQCLGHAHPALCPVRALLIRIPLGPRPWLRRLRSRSPGFVRRLRGYSAGV
jgi:hypothetical protein